MWVGTNSESRSAASSTARTLRSWAMARASLARTRVRSIRTYSVGTNLNDESCWTASITARTRLSCSIADLDALLRGRGGRALKHFKCLVLELEWSEHGVVNPSWESCNAMFGRFRLEL